MKRYRDDPSAPSHLRKLVESARVDGLDEQRRRLVAERLGIAPVARAPSAPSRQSSPPAATRASIPVGGLVLTAIALIGGTATYVVVNDQSAPESPLAAVSLTVPPPLPTSIVEPSPAPLAEPPSLVAEPPEPPSMPSVHVGALRDAPSERAPIAKPSPATEPGQKGGMGDLRLEIAALDGVRRATEGGQPRDALALLDDYAARFPAGKLREEALVLRIEALHASGNQAGAERLAQQLLRSSPNTPYAARVRSALAKGSPTKE